MKTYTDLHAIAQSVIRINNARLEGTLTRENHAKSITAINNDLTRFGLTWENVSDEIARIA